MEKNERIHLLETAPEQSRISTVKGIAAALITPLFVATSAVCVQGLNRTIPDFELNTLRNGFGWLGTLIACVIFKISPKVAGKRAHTLATLFYALLLVTEALTVYVAVTFIPLASQQSIYNTTNLCVGLILFWIFVKEKPTLDKVLAIVLCVVGVFLVLQPDFIFSESDHNRKEVRNETATIFENTIENDTETKCNTSIGENNVYSSSSHWHTYLGFGLTLLTGTVCATHVAIVRFYRDFFNNFQNQIITMFWTFFLGTIVSFLPMLAFEHVVLPSSTGEYLLCTGHILANFFIVPSDIYGCALIGGNAVNILHSTLIVYMALAQYTVLKDLFPGNRNWVEIVGVVLVLMGSIVSSVVQLLTPQKSSKEEMEPK